MNKLTLDIDTLQVQSFATAEEENERFGTVRGHAVKKTGPEDTNCSAIDACASSLGCTQFNCTVDLQQCPDTYDPLLCPSAVDRCPSQRGCTSLFPC